MGASASQTGPSQAEPEVSALRASVPCAVLKAEVGGSRNDLHWNVFDMEDGFVRWSGYNDRYWWERVSGTPGFRERVGKVTGRRYVLDPDTNRVSVFPASAMSARSAETEGRSPQDASAVGAAETPESGAQ